MSLSSSFSSEYRSSFLPTGSLILDRALGRGGFPRGSLIEVLAPEASGKTTLCLHTVSEAQKLGLRCLWIDCDENLTPQFAASRGVDIEELYYARCADTRSVMQIIHTVTQDYIFDLLVVDSFSTLFPDLPDRETNLSGEEEELRRQLPAWLHQLNLDLERTRSIAVFTRTLPFAPRVIYHGLANDMERLSLSLHASVRLKMEVIETLYINAQPNGWRSRVYVLKNGNLPCSDEVIIDIIYKDGIDKPNEMLALSIEYGLIEQKADGYYYHHRLLGPSANQASLRLRKDQSLREELEADIRRKIF